MVWNFLKGGKEKNVRVGGDNHGIIISGDNARNVTISYASVDTPVELAIPFREVTEPGNSSQLLSWKSRLPEKLIGREQELEALRLWCNSGPGIRVKTIAGGGGLGKTRLAFELAQALRKEGWQAGAPGGFNGTAGYTAGEKGLLFVLDYPEQHREVTQNLLAALSGQEQPEFPIRVLLLSREQDPLNLGQILPELFGEPLKLKHLDEPDDNWQLFKAAQEEFATILNLNSAAIDQTQFSQWQASHDLHKRPLFVLAQALNLLYAPGAIELAGPKVIAALVSRERSRLMNEASPLGIDTKGTIMLHALAAISGGLRVDQIDQLRQIANLETLPTSSQTTQLSSWQQTATDEFGVQQPGSLPLPEPDLFAACFLAEQLQENGQAGTLQYAALAAADDVGKAISRLGRLIYDATEVLQQQWPDQSLVEAVKGKIDWCRYLNQGLSRANLEYTLQELARQVSSTLVDAAESPQAQAAHLNNLSVRLAESGDRAGGLAASQRAVEIHETLAEENFAAYGADLASSLNNLSNRLAESGDRAGGLAVIQRAVEIRETLAEENFAANGPDLASSLNNLSNRLAESGDRAGGLAANQRAVDIHETLAEENFAAYGPDLASSLNNLSNRLGESGDRAGGLAASQRAVEIHETLAEENFAAYGPDLARSLNNLSIDLAASGDRAGGLPASQRAVEIHETLAEENFAANGPDLAMSLNNLSVRLGESGDRARGLAVIQRAVEIHETLAEENFAAYGPDLAMSLNNLSNLLAESGNRARGLAAIQRAVEIRETLAEENFAAYGPDLASSLNNLSVRLGESGDRAGGLAASQRAVEIRETLAEENFAAYGPGLASSLNNLSVRLGESGDRAGGLAAIKRAIEIITHFAVPGTQYEEWLATMQRSRDSLLKDE
ncbi:MAG: hypothetical protein DRQ54_09325 [Gammaproteobacteria bacterium]|nr:MAG: hypothetical protein DRQ54_09325 [Gammaproteobacteria bacterium]